MEDDSQPQTQAAAAPAAAPSQPLFAGSHASVIDALLAPPSLTAQPFGASAASATAPIKPVQPLSGHNARSPHRHVPAAAFSTALTGPVDPPTSAGVPSSAAFARPTDASAAAAASAAASSSAAASASPASSAPAYSLLQSPRPVNKKRSSAQYDHAEATSVAAPPRRMDDGPSAAALPSAALTPLMKRARARSDEDDDDDDDEDDGMDDKPRKAPGAASSGGGGKVAQVAEDDADSSFMSLLNKLASLEFPDQLEPCPCCPEQFPLSEFAAHVYKCIQKLDADERRAQEELDAKLAERIAMGDGDYERSDHRHRRGGGTGRRGLQLYGRPVTPEAVEEQERELLAQFASSKRKVCEKGRDCLRTDASHFESLHHPDVACPMCDEEYPVYEINAHITICLDRPAALRSKKKIAEADAAMDGSAVDKSSAGAAASSSAVASASSSSAFPAGAFSSTAITIPSSSLLPRSRARKPPHRSSSSGNMARDSRLRDDDDEINLLASPDEEDDDAAADDEADDDEPSAQPLGRSSAAAAVSSVGDEEKMSSLSSSSGAPLQRSHSERTLSLAQASAMASLMIKHKTAGTAGGGGSGGSAAAGNGASSNGEKDPSLLELLNTFSSLGFTRENLEALHAQHEQLTDKKSPEAASKDTSK